MSPFFFETISTQQLTECAEKGLVSGLIFTVFGAGDAFRLFKNAEKLIIDDIITAVVNFASPLVELAIDTYLPSLADIKEFASKVANWGEHQVDDLVKAIKSL